MIALLFLVFVQCQSGKKVNLVDYRIKECDENSFGSILSDELQLKNRIKHAFYHNDRLVLDVVFTESCGFVIDPMIRFQSGVLDIYVDQYIADSTRMYAMCICCYELELFLTGLENIPIDSISYRLHLSGNSPEKIYFTDSLYHTYENIDYVLVGEDRIYYAQQISPYKKRMFSGLMQDSSYVDSYFPDHSDIFYRKSYNNGAELFIENGFFERRDSLGVFYEKGTVEYQKFKEKKGVQLILKSRKNKTEKVLYKQ